MRNYKWYLAELGWSASRIVQDSWNDWGALLCTTWSSATVDCTAWYDGWYDAYLSPWWSDRRSGYQTLVWQENPTPAPWVGRRMRKFMTSLRAKVYSYIAGPRDAKYVHFQNWKQLYYRQRLHKQKVLRVTVYSTTKCCHPENENLPVDVRL